MTRGGWLLTAGVMALCSGCGGIPDGRYKEALDRVVRATAEAKALRQRAEAAERRLARQEAELAAEARARQAALADAARQRARAEELAARVDRLETEQVVAAGDTARLRRLEEEQRLAIQLGLAGPGVCPPAGDGDVGARGASW